MACTRERYCQVGELVARQRSQRPSVQAAKYEGVAVVDDVRPWPWGSFVGGARPTGDEEVSVPGGPIIPAAWRTFSD